MIDHFFHPDGVAIIGATDNAAKGGYHILRNTLAGYKGRVYPVNPRYGEILGTKCYPDIESIPENFDLAIYFIPAKSLPDTIRACSKKGVKAIIIESAGFSEVGEEGGQLQRESVDLARSFGIRLWGPNCMGLLDGHSRNVFSFMYTDKWMTLMKPGAVSLIVQSGMLSAGFLMMILERGGMGIAKVCSIGNKCDVNETELLEYLVADEETGVIACYLESIVDGRKFLELARSTPKPIIVLKAGRSEQGAKAAMSHTASLSGSAAVYEGAFRQAGVVQVYDVHELMDFARGFSKITPCGSAGGTAVITFSGGAGIVTSDLLADHGVRLAEFGPETIRALTEVFPPWMKPSHPVDVWPAVELNGLEFVYGKAVEALMQEPNVDSIIIESIAWHLSTPGNLVAAGEMQKRYRKPVVLWQIGHMEANEHYRAVAEEAGIPVFTEISRCAAFIAGVKAHSRKKAVIKTS
ncbi:MAG: CoA-binding protein [Spirochaetes bacterium]|jgi:acetyltransferase|nr:CoA-binding protein [Spirochaetota bacterium]